MAVARLQCRVNKRFDFLPQLRFVLLQQQMKGAGNLK